MNNLNNSQGTNFTCGSKEFSETNYRIQNVSLPGINLNPTEINGRSGARFITASDTIEYDSLDLEIIIDENFSAYKEIMGIVKKNISVEKGTFADFVFDFWIEGNNSLGNSKIKWEFHGCRILAVGGMEFSTVDESTERSMTMSMKFDYFEIISNNVPTLRV